MKTEWIHPLLADFYAKDEVTEIVVDEDGKAVTETVEQVITNAHGHSIVVTTTQPVYQTFIEYTLFERGETRSIADVWRVAEAHRGKRDDLIQRFLVMADKGLQWGWFDQCSAIILANPDLDEDQLAALFPSRPTPLSWVRWSVENYKRLREIAYPSKEAQFEMQYDDSVSNSKTWQTAIEAVKRQYPKSLL